MENSEQVPGQETKIDWEDVDRVIRYLRQVVDDTEDVMMGDPNYPSEILLKAAKALQPGLPDQEVVAIAKATEADLKLVEDNSPYAEVRACVDAFDDTALPAMTFRMWIIGLSLGALAAAFNQFFLARSPGMVLDHTVVQVVAYPIGRFFAKVLPTRVFYFGKRSFTFNPGPFNIKEHVLISIMANASPSPYATGVIGALRAKTFYNDTRFSTKIGFQLAFVTSTQLMGFALAGVTRSFLIHHREMFPVSHDMNAGLVGGPSSNHCSTSVTWQRPFTTYTRLEDNTNEIPHHMRNCFRDFWTTWIDPNNVKLALITGTVTGLGLNPMPTLDWNFMMQGPIFTPLWSIVCTIDMGTNHYNASRVLDQLGRFDQTKYKSYSLPFMSAALIVFSWRPQNPNRKPSYTCNLALYSSVIVYSMIYYRKHLVGGISHYIASWTPSFKSNRQCNSGELYHATDIHYRLMTAYPGGKYQSACMNISSRTLRLTCQTQLAMWGLVLGELVGGYAFAGRHFTVTKALIISADMKFAHYMKSLTGKSQHSLIFANAISRNISFVEVQPDCSASQEHFTKGVSTDSWFQFSESKSIYPGLEPSFLFYPGSPPKDGPTLVGDTCKYPTFILSLFFQGYLKRWYMLWYAKYAVVLASAIPAGIAIFGLVYFFAFKMNGQEYNWAGNTIYKNGCDNKGCALMDVPDDGFGPKYWE
ncbi:putative oligopeptide transporter [Melampsora larici-populina 98AG31]|uniref:Putative oligopeptide transporter n=1 Tax=Melampsora larici-populina (strain 98AG31 / pathotype 3-4-7) TaxID=747676 RepID=F4R6H0_MELLP|nr:putative oligopeptide transporter [Melampsora larici-populina 98AG31]EGG12465.1 putative oligopeptide transporter [Melampsora larici-populina 98AG31]